jgi:hypothetical protein
LLLCLVLLLLLKQLKGREGGRTWSSSPPKDCLCLLLLMVRCGCHRLCELLLLRVVQNRGLQAAGRVVSIQLCLKPRRQGRGGGRSRNSRCGQRRKIRLLLLLLLRQHWQIPRRCCH